MALSAVRSGRLRSVAISIVATALILSGLIVAMGANPVDTLSALVRGAVGSPFNIGQTVVIGGILILTALAAAIPFSARLFNVGGEGQLMAGATASVSVALALGPSPWTTLLSVAAGVLGGAAWALVPGLIKALLGGSEMIVSLLMNFVAALMAGYAVRSIFPDTSGQSSRLVDRDVRLPEIWGAGGVHVGIILCLVLAIGAWVLMSHTGTGLAIRAVGLNDKAAALAGFSDKKITVLTFALAGGAAGLAGSLLILGTTGQLTETLSSGYGFIGVVVALLAGLRPAWIPLVAFLTAGLMVGSNRLQIDVGLPFSMGIVVLSVLVLTLLATRVIVLRRN